MPVQGHTWSQFQGKAGGGRTCRTEMRQRVVNSETHRVQRSMRFREPGLHSGNGAFREPVINIVLSSRIDEDGRAGGSR